MQKTQIQTDIGILTIVGNKKGISKIFFENEIELSNNFEVSDNLFIEECVIQMKEYFAGERKIFTFKINIEGTEFQKKVWAEMLKIIFGETVSYKQLAARIDNPKAVRAVANANARNPLPIVVPCHRVIGSNGKLTGFRGELWRKKYLLDLEQKCLIR